MLVLKPQTFIVIFACITNTNTFDFYESVASVGSFLKKSSYNIYDSAKTHTYCKVYRECCTKNEIPADFNGLEKVLRKRLYGQHIVLDNLINILRSHWMMQSQKALTISFHGWTGGGKNYVSRFIQKFLYAKGSKSAHVHHFMGRLHFPLEENVNIYKNNLYHWIKGNVSNCEKQLFVFDEVDKMPAGVLDILKPFIDYNDNVEKVDYRKSIFIFLSNTGGTGITSLMIDWWKSGKHREQIRLQDFEELIQKGAFNEKGGFYFSDTIKSNLIDHYIPFLPLEREHVKLCIIDEFQKRNVNSPTGSDIMEVMESVQWAPDVKPIYSKTGCKRLSQKVASYVIQKYPHVVPKTEL